MFNYSLIQILGMPAELVHPKLGRVGTYTPGANPAFQGTHLEDASWLLLEKGVTIPAPVLADLMKGLAGLEGLMENIITPLRRDAKERQAARARVEVRRLLALLAQ